VDPPPGFRDATEYSYAGPAGRRLTLSAAGPPAATDADLVAAARALGYRLTDLTGAPVVLSAVQARAAGGSALELVIPAADGRRLRVALVRAGGEVRQVALDAPDPDGTADADFRSAVAALAPPPGYRDATAARTFRETAGPRAVRVAFADDAPAAPTGPFRRASGRDEADQPFEYELLPPPARPAAEADVAALPGPTAALVVEGRRVVVEVRGPDDDPRNAELARQVAESISRRPPTP
jgi:hypothetical protein